MEKQYLRRKLPDLLIIDGFWNVGKTTIIGNIQKINKLSYIQEPDHLKFNIQKNISEWYKKEHQTRFQIATEKIEKGEKVVMERSSISSMSYLYAINKKFSSQDVLDLRKNSRKIDITLIFLYGSRDFIKKQSIEIKDREIRELIQKNDFYDKYLEFYQKILPRYIKMNINIIKVDKNNNFKTSKNILDLFYKQFPLLEKLKVSCASMVAHCNNKILLLYDHKYKHYVLPQGHQELGEALKKTAVREMIEETGFNNLKVIKKIAKYQYNYPTENKIIYKTIHVYLLEILGLSKVKKSLESHENYSNKFFNFEDAIKNARWLQDKEAIKKSWAYKKSPYF